jgi:hypothetical protein
LLQWPASPADIFSAIARINEKAAWKGGFFVDAAPRVAIATCQRQQPGFCRVIRQRCNPHWNPVKELRAANLRGLGSLVRAAKVCLRAVGRKIQIQLADSRRRMYVNE